MMWCAVSYLVLAICCICVIRYRTKEKKTVQPKTYGIECNFYVSSCCVLCCPVDVLIARALCLFVRITFETPKS